MLTEYEYENTVMGGTFSIAFITEQRSLAESLFEKLYTKAKWYETTFSRFMPESLLSQLNARGTSTVTPEVMNVITMGKKLFETTKGVFNPLISIERLGYDADIEIVRNTERVSKMNEPYAIDWETVLLEKSSVQFKNGQHIDVGGYLKGYVAELLAKQAQESGILGCIVNVGGDIYTWGKDAQNATFCFSIENPLEGTTPIHFSYTDGALATSGSYRRFWNVAGKRVFHILDAGGIQNPETDLISVTVLASRGDEADAFATTALILGAAAGSAFLSAQGSEYCFITTRGEVIYSSAFPAN